MAQPINPTQPPGNTLPGISFTSLETVFSALGLDLFSGVALVSAARLSTAFAPLFSPAYPALIGPLASPEIAAGVWRALSVNYPADFAARLVHQAGTAEQTLEDTALNAIAACDSLGDRSLLYLPALGEDTALEFFQDVVAHLRDPLTGCPWDKEQTHASLRPYLLEETYETLEALDSGDMRKVSEELGDLLLQIVLHAQIGVVEGEFTLADVLQGINRKIIRRHPHVFGDVEVSGVSGVLRNWERLKAEERQNKSETEKGLLDSVPRILAALALAQEYQDRAARVGFDWSEIGPVRAKIFEELEEVETAPDEQARAGELGDLLFAVVNLVRWYKVDAETALRETSNRFRRRFEYIERTARSQGRALNEMTLAEMDVLWEQAKDME
ncbi:MAG TPA: nucleoside triphosphate pyrophosphohydrolase [Anaerolineaceae bacterium]